MERRFYFADAFWFRVPLKVLVLGVAVFAFLSLYHGGSFVEIELARPRMTRFWIAVREHDDFLALLRQITSLEGGTALSTGA